MNIRQHVEQQERTVLRAVLALFLANWENDFKYETLKIETDTLYKLREQERKLYNG